MSSNSPSNPQQNLNWRDQRRAEREERLRARWEGRGGPWVGGSILILLGIIFLAQTIGALAFENWWALFILLPAAGSFGAAWRSFAIDGQFTGRVIGSMIAGIGFIVLTVVFLFNLDLTWIGPVLLIVFGIGILVSALLRPTVS